ncbi:MAG: recombinase family protein, partial [Phycisphaerae bacterium]
MDNTHRLIPKDPGGPLHVMMIGRISTPQQHLSNIEASYTYARGTLVGKWDGPIEIKAFGEQASGLKVDRVTIKQAYEQINAGWPDVVLLEDMSRAYRNPRFLIAFVQDCADADIRVIAPGDNLDTADENWEVTLGAAALRHGLFIPDTRRRVRRTATSSFHKGGMVLRVRFGYRRLTKEEAATGKFGPPGLRLAKDQEQGIAIRHILEWIIRDKPQLDEVVKWLTEQGLPTGPYVKSGKWRVPALRDLLKDPILYGLRRFRNLAYKCIFNSGDYLREKNPTPEKEDFPALAHMTKAEWDELQTALKAMGNGYQIPAGPESPRYRVARSKSILPLQWATCACCGDFMYLAGDNVIKCQNSLHCNGNTCWNHVQVACPLFREKVVDLLLAQVTGCPGA